MLVANLRPDQDGVVTIPADIVKGLPILQIVVSDPVNLLQRTITAPTAESRNGRPAVGQGTRCRPADVVRASRFDCQPDEPLDLDSLGSAQLQVYGSFGSLLKLYKTLVGDPRLAEFDPLAEWHTLDHDAKLDAYSRLAGHELHLFLWSYDRAFFDEVVRPYLANKKEKQFIDHWLLEKDLSSYTTLWRYNQLNAAERALLALRLPAARELVRRELRERVAQQDENHHIIRQQIESALKLEGLANGRDMERSKMSQLYRRQLGVVDEKIVAEREPAENRAQGPRRFVRNGKLGVGC